MVFLHFIIKKLFKKRTARVLLRLAAGKWVLFTCVRKEGRKEGAPVIVTSFLRIILGGSSGWSRYPCRRAGRASSLPELLLLE